MKGVRAKGSPIMLEGGFPSRVFSKFQRFQVLILSSSLLKPPFGLILKSYAMDQDLQEGKLTIKVIKI